MAHPPDKEVILIPNVPHGMVGVMISPLWPGRGDIVSGRKGKRRILRAFTSAHKAYSPTRNRLIGYNADRYAVLVVLRERLHRIALVGHADT